ncbi:MAG: phage holin family protein [Anaerolineae bacterium]
MTNVIRNVVRWLLRGAIVWFVDSLSLAAAAALLPGMWFEAVGTTPIWTVVVAAALVIAFVNFLIRPIVLIIARPLGWIVIFLVGFVLSALAIWIAAWLLPGFNTDFVSAILASLVIAFFNAALSSMIELNEDGSYYQNLIERRAKANPSPYAKEPGRALMMVEVDGLSYHHIKKAIEEGRMPHLKRLMEEEGYQLSRVECGLPSMTSACQAGIMFGDNYDIPAFRWYDKDSKKLYVSSSDAGELNARYAHGHGLMREGASILNMLNGDASVSLFTMANIFTGTEADKKQRSEDVTLLMFNPYFLTRSIVLFIGETMREVWEGFKQRARNVQPRLNRLEHWYPFVRGAMCGLMRDMSANVAVLEMMRGSPSIYMLYLGYDEVAHHSGPWTTDAFGDLHRLDRTLGQIYRVAKERAPRYYEFLLLSDHGQSFGATFKQRYGVSIKEFIEQQLPHGTTVSQMIGGDTGAMGLTGVAGELSNAQSSDTGGFNRMVARQGQKLAETAQDKVNSSEDARPASVTAYGSGNAAQVYFDLYPRKIKLSELNAAYPGVVDALVQHPGLGMVVGYADDGTAVILGKGGSRNLHTGEVQGDDPLKPYAPDRGPGQSSIEKRVWQLKRVMDFPHAGDLWLISTLYPDGTVAALEELVGNHGGVGGEQTDAFIFHPPDMEVPETQSCMDVFHILNAQRGKPIPAPAPAPVTTTVPDWSPRTLAQGIVKVGTWVPLAAKCAALWRQAYHRVVDEPLMTGPALLIAAVAMVLRFVALERDLRLLNMAIAFGIWMIAVGIVTAAGYWLSKKGNYTRMVRGVGFGQAIYFLSPLALIPWISSVMAALILVLNFLGVWIGAAAAAQIKGWRTLLLPVVVILVTVLATALVNILLSGAAFTLRTLLANLGMFLSQ